jgi:DNA-binding response OmpR family regulator
MSEASEKAHILLVDDDPFTFQLERRLLGDDHYRFSTARDGADCMVKVEADRPDVILMDYMMPGMNGIETCKRLRSTPDNHDIYIIFVSAQESAEARLMAYDAGADDYMTKPLSSEEIRRKVEIAVRHRQEMVDLRRDLSNTLNMAMTALTAGGELGVVLHFFNKAFACKSLEALTRAVLEAIASYGLTGTVQIRQGDDLTTLNSEGRCSLVEQELLRNLAADTRRIFDYGTRTVVNFPHVMLLAKNMPVDEAERHGRVKDNIALLVEGAEYRAQALQGELSLRRRQQRLAAAARLAEQGMGAIEERYRGVQAEMSSLLFDLERGVESAFNSMGLTETQENRLMGVIQPLARKATLVSDKGAQIDAQLSSVLTALQEAISSD